MTRLADKTIITQALSPTNKPVPRFFESDFRDAIIRQGYDVIHERAIKCSCKGRNSEHLSDCKNCGATGWIYVNPTKTRMVVQSMSLNPKYESWGVYGAEVSSVTALPEDKLSYMDKVTVLGAVSEHSEALHTSILTQGQQQTKYVYTVYNILDIYFVGLFVDSNTKLTKLEENVDYTFSGNKVIFTNENLIENSSVSIRYSHNPAYYIQEMVRDTMQVNLLKGRIEEKVMMPIHARAKRIDLFKDRENFSGDRLLDNSFKVCDPSTITKNNC